MVTSIRHNSFMWKIKSHLRENSDGIGYVNNITYRDFVSERMIDLTVCAEISEDFAETDNFVQESDELSSEDIMPDDGITTWTKLITCKLQHEDPALIEDHQLVSRSRILLFLVDLVISCCVYLTIYRHPVI